MATKLADLTVGADGSWSSGPHTMTAGSKSVTLRRKSDGGILVTRGFTVAASATAVSDDFNWTNASTLGANWTQLSGTTYRFGVQGNYANASASTAGDYWSANTFNSNQYAETSLAPACAVRMQAAAHSCYFVTEDTVDEGDGYMTAFYYLNKVVSGTVTQLGQWGYDSGGAGDLFSGVFRLEANGTTISFKTAASHGGTLTTRISVTDSSLSGGAPGLYAGSGSVQADNWYGGDL